MSDDGDDNIIPFPRGQFEVAQNKRESLFDEEPIRSKRDGRSCWHSQHGVWVDSGTRKVTCRGCGTEMDPIDALAWLASQREQLLSRGLNLRREADDLYVRVEDLKRQERNAKSRIRSARKRGVNDEAIRRALEMSKVRIGGYQPWAELSEPQREVTMEKARLLIEAFFGALDEIADEARAQSS